MSTKQFNRGFDIVSDATAWGKNELEPLEAEGIRWLSSLIPPPDDTHRIARASNPVSTWRDAVAMTAPGSENANSLTRLFRYFTSNIFPVSQLIKLIVKWRSCLYRVRFGTTQ